MGSKTVWMILLFGVGTVLFLTVGMLMTLTQFQGTPAWMQTKLGNTIKHQFGFVSAGTEQAYDGRITTLKIQYEATPGKAAFDQALGVAEMTKVAEFAISKVDPRDRITIDEISVRRLEIHGRGCFQNLYSANHSMPNPLKKMQLRPDQLVPERNGED